MSKMSRMHDDYYDPDKYLWPDEFVHELPVECLRCKRDLEPEHQNGNPCDDPHFNYLDREYCSGVCEALAIRDELKELGLFTEKDGLNYQALDNGALSLETSK